MSETQTGFAGLAAMAQDKPLDQAPTAQQGPQEPQAQAVEPQTQTPEPQAQQQEPQSDGNQEPQQPKAAGATQEPSADIQEPTSKVFDFDKASQDSPVEIPESVNDDVVVNYLRSKGVDVDDLNSFINRSNQDPFVSNELKSANDWMKETNRSFSDYLLMQRLDVDNMDNMSAIKQSLMLGDPYYQQNPDALQYELDKYDVTSLQEQIDEKKELLDDETDETEIRKLKRDISSLERSVATTKAAFERDAFDAKSKLSDLRKKINVPAQPSQPQLNPEAVEYHKNLVNEFKQYDAIPMTAKVGDQEKKVNVRLTAQERDVVADIMSKYKPFEDKKSFASAYRNVVNMIAAPKMFQAGIEEGLNLGKLNLIKEEKNVTMSSPSGMPNDSVAENIDQQSLQALKTIFG